jgi:hypothetical protein
MSHAPLPLLPQRGFGETTRRDAWWIQPLVFITVIVVFFGYLTWAAFQNEHYELGGYLSPAYSPVLWGDGHHSWFGPKPAWWPGLLPFSPALLILPFPGLFRFTCYYYRGAYYKAFWADPPNCSVGEPRKSYLGENSFPLILQNLHRYALYIALVFIVILSYDLWKALWFQVPGAAAGTMEFGIGIGTLVLALNLVCIASYTFGCHAFRHLIGGYRDELSKSKVSEACYNCSSKLNRWHMNWAYMSLVSVAFADLYVRLCSMGVWTDYRLI